MNPSGGISVKRRFERGGSLLGKKRGGGGGVKMELKAFVYSTGVELKVSNEKKR